MDNDKIIKKCKELLESYKNGELGQTKMPEESHPDFNRITPEERLAYFTLPMALNYQRDSYKLWLAALATYNDEETKIVFNASWAAKNNNNGLQKLLLKHKLAMQPNKHTETWRAICATIAGDFGSFWKLMEKAGNDYLKLKEIVQVKQKKGFPYLSGPKIFNYWSFIIQEYGGVKLKNSEYIEIAPDTHVTKCSVLLGVIDEAEAHKISKERLSEKWRNVLGGSGITPIEMHPPLWFWSKNNFKYLLKN